ncbi:hypothetical protein GCU67_20005 [Modestobacter muralis]|uniref:Peptidase S26 domain-containing protein n=1 Tax=Modestobacter muralis TaxID=1608614 RepID=A0A6P0EXL1_9ACTN|nr:hypothetical protein [Modestobacter muralis]NEN53332.1 hypothetical protein [Modestobacter muralis]
MLSPAALLRGRVVDEDGVPRPSPRALRAAASAAPGRDRRTLPASWRSRWPAFVVSCAARALLIGLLWLVGWSLVPAAVGWESTVVVSGSMSPRLQVGDVVVARPVETDQLRTGMVLLVDDPDRPGRLRVHRLVALEGDQLRLRGDANASDDSTLVDRDAVHGVGALRLPVIGWPLVWLSERHVLPLAGAAAGLVLLVGAALLHEGPAGPSPTRTRTRTRTRTEGAHRPPGRLRTLLASRPGRSAATPPRHRHRHRPPRPRTRLTVTVTGLLMAVVSVVTTSTADARYTARTTNDADAWSANAHYTCAQAAASPAATLYYPLQETTGTVATNAGSTGTVDNGTYEGSMVLGQSGPNCRGAGRAVSLDGSTTYITSPLTVTDPNTYSLEIWLNTTTPGGLVMGFRRDGGSGNDNDRMVYMGNFGRISFGLEPTAGTYQTVRSPGAYDDGAWHHVVATQGSNGIALYVDAVKVAGDATATTGFNASGTWRIGRGQTAGWPNEPSNRYYTGLLAHAAVYPSVLTDAQIRAHYNAGR